MRARDQRAGLPRVPSASGHRHWSQVIAGLAAWLGGEAVHGTFAPPAGLYGALRIWSAVGAAGGLAYGLGLGGRGTVPRTLLGGLSGALLGTIGYELAGALAFPLAGTGHAVSATAPSRLLACLCATIPVAIGALLAVPAPPARASSAGMKPRGMRPQDPP